MHLDTRGARIHDIFGPLFHPLFFFSSLSCLHFSVFFFLASFFLIERAVTLTQWITPVLSYSALVSGVSPLDVAFGSIDREGAVLFFAKQAGGLAGEARAHGMGWQGLIDYSFFTSGF